jgi:hypothetical protein
MVHPSPMSSVWGTGCLFTTSFVPVAQFGDTLRLGHLRLMVDSGAVLRLHARHLKQQALVLRCLL